MKALVAMSGGVDSSVAAAMALDEGWDLVGITLKQWVGDDGSLPITGCCTLADAEDARRAAATLGIPHYVLDFTEEFAERVVDPFLDAYAGGLTPNPCVACNRDVRFGALVDRADALGCDVVVTGHHARARDGDSGPRLLRATDRSKDQSYVLHAIGSDALRRARFPVGEITKGEVRRRAADLGMRVADKPDSQDLCFLGGSGPRDFLKTHAPDAMRPGNFVDVDGAVLGSHDGAAGFTIGQRRGLGVAVGEPRYVVSVDTGESTVVLGRREDLLASGCTVTGVGLIAPMEGPIEGSVQVRYRSEAAPALVTPAGDGGWVVEFTDPVEAVTPGQAAVLYRGDEVIGGGTISRVAGTISRATGTISRVDGA